MEAHNKHLKHQLVLSSVRQVTLHSVRSNTQNNIQACIIKTYKNICIKMADMKDVTGAIMKAATEATQAAM